MYPVYLFTQSELFLFMFQVFCWAQSLEVTLWGQSPSPPLHLQSCPPPQCQLPHTQRLAAETAAPRRRRVRRPASRAHPPCRAFQDPAGSAAQAPSTYPTVSLVQLTHAQNHIKGNKPVFFRFCFSMGNQPNNQQMSGWTALSCMFVFACNWWERNGKLRKGKMDKIFNKIAFVLFFITKLYKLDYINYKLLNMQFMQTVTLIHFCDEHVFNFWTKINFDTLCTPKKIKNVRVIQLSWYSYEEKKPP